MASRKALVIGGYGHIGGFLVPRLVETGWDIAILTRGRKASPRYDNWKNLPHGHVEADYGALCSEGTWKALLDEISPDVVIDILSANAPAVLDACPSSVRQFVITGSVWMYGPPRVVPTPEETQNEFPFGFYRKRYSDLLGLLGRKGGPAVTAVMPSNIAGPGKIPLDPYGGRDIEVHHRMARGGEILLPARGETLVCPSDASDIAEVFVLALERPDKAAGRMFNAGAAHALTYNEMVAEYGGCYGVDIPVRHVSWEEFDGELGLEASARYHHEAHMCPDISAARNVLAFEPRYTPRQALQRAVEWMRAEGLLDGLGR